MSITLYNLLETLTEFININFLPFLDTKNKQYVICIQNWESLQENMFRKISNFKSDDEIKSIAQQILKNFKNYDAHVNFKMIDNSNDGEQKLQLRDRKISLDTISRKYTMSKKQERPNSYHENQPIGKDDFIELESSFAKSPHHLQQSSEKSKNYQERQILSFKSISDYHKSRNNISTVKQLQINNQSEIHTISKKSIDELGSPNNRGKNYSHHYIESIKKIAIDKSPQPTKFIDVDTSYEPIETLKTEQNEVLNTSLPHGQEESIPLSKLKSKLSEPGSIEHSLLSQPPVINDSFQQFMSSFKKLCTTFQSNHTKLLREDFNNKYINC